MVYDTRGLSSFQAASSGNPPFRGDPFNLAVLPKVSRDNHSEARLDDWIYRIECPLHIYCYYNFTPASYKTLMQPTGNMQQL